MLTDAERKVLTKFLGECWHIPVWSDGPRDAKEFRCQKCRKKAPYPGINILKNRTFATPDDLHAVYSAMVRKGEWNGWMNYANMKCGWKDFDPIRDNAFNYLCQYIFCLNAPEQIEERMKMAAEFMEGKC